MTHNQGLAQRIVDTLAGTEGMQAKRMFGGVGYLIAGNMASGVHGDRLVVRVGPDRYRQALEGPHTGELDLTGRPMRGWVMVDSEGLSEGDALEAWVRRGVEFAQSSPPKRSGSTLLKGKTEALSQRRHEGRWAAPRRIE